MPNEIHRKLLVSLFSLDFDTNFAELDGVADADLVWSAPVTSCGACDFVEVFATIKTGTSPTAGRSIEFYVERGDDGSPEKRSGTTDITTTDHGEETNSADITRVLGTLRTPVAIIVVDATSNTSYTISFRIPYPGPDWNLYVYNNSGAALNGTGSPHSVSARGWGPEVQ